MGVMFVPNIHSVREDKIKKLDIFIKKSIGKLNLLPNFILKRIIEIEIKEAYNDGISSELKVILRIKYIWIFCKKDIYITVI